MRMYMRLLFFILIAIVLSGCSSSFSGGGRDLLTIDLPFSPGYDAVCTQGAYGEYSHNSTSTRFDVDFDTPNTSDEYVYAPVSGRMYVHDSGETGFGLHVNIDQSDGTYIVLGHLKEVFVDSGSEIALGQLIGFEGSTGHSSGDHVHIGRHRGRAQEPATSGQSIDGLAFVHRNGNTSTSTQTTAMHCSLMEGDTYTSNLGIVRGHPSGSLLKSPRESTVYLVENGDLRPFLHEGAFFARGYSFSDVAVTSEEELECYDPGLVIEQGSVRVLREGSEVWIVHDYSGTSSDQRLHVPVVSWREVVASYGAHPNSVSDLSQLGSFAHTPSGGEATFRDGTLISPVSYSDVYVMQGGVGMPIDSWETLLALGWEDRHVFELTEAQLAATVRGYGSCEQDFFCLRREDVRECHDLPDLSSYDAFEPGESEDSFACSQAELTFESPWGVVDQLVLSGDHLVDGMSTGWVDVLDHERDDDVLEYPFSACVGDAFHFSVAFIDGAEESWSCHAPFPPGILQGEARVSFQGEELVPIAWDAPTSDGCDLYVAFE